MDNKSVLSIKGPHQGYATEKVPKIRLNLDYAAIKGERCYIGATGGGRGACGRAPPPAFHTLAKDMPVNRGGTHFSLGLRPCIISSLLLQIYLSKITQLRP